MKALVKYAVGSGHGRCQKNEDSCRSVKKGGRGGTDSYMTLISLIHTPSTQTVRLSTIWLPVNISGKKTACDLSCLWERERNDWGDLYMHSMLSVSRYKWECVLCSALFIKCTHSLAFLYAQFILPDIKTVRGVFWIESMLHMDAIML